ncbi:MAG: 4Fe-4S binding protein [Gammaproteobacteria bacterium]|nr:4Fe-4S binding protein [Gammaproteobacteria bacterium]MBU1653830.1 4Fe-4S binding protein [Gammaproteobacteria bacterium]MBU1961649.1 4Fe-4S binding protein [Gammaproteobacteria bacterium]
MSRTDLQQQRAWFQAGFFVLFVAAPPLDIFRLDLSLGHFILLGQDWTLGIDGFLAGREGIGQASFNIFWRGFLPLFGGAALFLWIAWRFGRLYCGWLCPHFSVVEVVNHLMWRASGKPSLWERKPLPRLQPDGSLAVPDRRYWPAVIIAVLAFSFAWALALLTYLLPPAEIYRNLFSGQLTPNQLRFLVAATLAFAVEFSLARHLFCRFGCAVGLFQSLAWMANNRAMVVGFDTRRARECADCNNACDNACPMRLKPRTLKRKMFTCTECAECISACHTKKSDRGGLLHWVSGTNALPVVTGRGYPESMGKRDERE